MKRRMFLKMCGAGVLGWIGVSAGSAKDRKRRPNIIFIFIDDVGTPIRVASAIPP